MALSTQALKHFSNTTCTTIPIFSTIQSRFISKTSATQNPTAQQIRQNRISQLENEWKENPRWSGLTRRYTAADVEALQGSMPIEHSIAKHGAEKFWHLLKTTPYIKALGALTGNQAMQQVKAGMQAIYISGWQVAADANLAGDMYPYQSLYPANSVPALVRSINKTLQRADQIHHAERDYCVEDWFVPLVADAEAGFGGVLNAFEITKAMIDAGAAAVHFEDQLASAKKCGHMGGKVLVPTSEAIDKLVSARLAADTMGVPTVIIARTDGEAASLITADVDPNDRQFCTGKRTPEGFFCTKPGLQQSISRALAYAPFADLLWCETATPNLAYAKAFAQAIHAHFPGKPLAYNCSPSFNWKSKLSDADIASFQEQIAKMGYKFQFITLAGFHALNYSMFDLSLNYVSRGMTAFVDLQQKEFAASEYGFTAVKHQREVGTGYFDSVTNVIQQGQSSITALKGSTEEEQFDENGNVDQKAVAQH